jgi:Peptidase C39 family
MNVTQNVTIPYQSQSGPEIGRRCGAVCLSMVYRSFGREVPQAEIWPAIAKENRFGSLASTTHLMAKDALSRGFAAVAILTRHPLQALRLCRESGIRAILNHRLSSETRAGHYTVLVDIDETNVTLHDPFFGPARRLSHGELLELWQPRQPNSEIVGNVLIGIGDQPSPASSCALCQSTIPSAVECARCKKPVPLLPNALLGCMNTACVNRMWDYVCCPSCDYTWTFNLQAGPSGALSPVSADAQQLSGTDKSPWMMPLFGELDKFCQHILSLPGAAGHLEIKRHLEMIGASKEKIVLAQSESLAYAKMAQDQSTKMQEASKQRKEEHRKKMEELNTPLPPLDGNNLGRALLKNLGLDTPNKIASSIQRRQHHSYLQPCQESFKG